MLTHGNPPADGIPVRQAPADRSKYFGIRMTRQKTSHVDSAAGVGRRVRSPAGGEGLRQGDLAFPVLGRLHLADRVRGAHPVAPGAARAGTAARREHRAPRDRRETRPPTRTRSPSSTRSWRSASAIVDAAEDAYARLRSSDTIAVRARALRGLAELALETGSGHVGARAARRARPVRLRRARRAGLRVPRARPATDGDLAAALASSTRRLEGDPEPTGRFRLHVL